uniref:Uncharacterized protein n=1 Tax=uncultured Desulfobacterium sp. TaxID=201089 RepID=E1YK76_9BACT|nr:hypothetical protein N47_E51920 [uncultured Desulfobacterium sp.]
MQSSNNTIYFLLCLFSMLTTIVAVQLLKSIAQKVNAVDIPNPRKIHTYPIPKIGGIGMALGIFIPFIAWLPLDNSLASILIGCAIVVTEGFIDDTRDLNYKIKFISQIAAALVIILYGGIKIRSLGMLLPEGFIIPEIPSILLTLFVIVGVTNAINLSDGLDGLAGGITLLSFICIGYLAFRVENQAVLIISMSVSGAIFGFLRFNTFPAEVFMGDAGSQLLGFLAITLSLAITQGHTALTPILPLIILGFPVLDTLTVMVERVRNGRPPFAADKNHFHHKLMKLGLYHSEAVFSIYVLQTFLISAALYLKYYSAIVVLLLYSAFSIVVLAGFNIAEKNNIILKRYDLIDVRY